MGKGRLEAFSDGVIAIIITIMVLELKVPHGTDLHALRPLVPDFLSYILSFIYIGIYWNNHHHLLQAVRHVSGSILWANLHLLFWLSLVPFATGWMGENHFAATPVALYGGVLILCAVAYTILARRLVRHHGARLGDRSRHGARSQGQCVVAVLRAGHPVGISAPGNRVVAVRRGRDDLAGPGSPHREGAGPTARMSEGVGGRMQQYVITLLRDVEVATPALVAIETKTAGAVPGPTSGRRARSSGT